MPEDLIRYDILAQDALRGLVRKVLSEVARTGLPGEHHFFVTFATTAPGVRVSTRLLAQYPEEMTIILQHQYWDLVVTEHALEVGLSFNNIPERLFVPFTAVKSFSDPSVGFQLQFAVVAAPQQTEGAPPIALATSAEAEKNAEPDEAAEETPPVTGIAEVVSLDAFRKK